MSTLTEAFAALRTKPGAEHIKSAFDQYRSLLGKGDVDAIGDLFTPDAIWEEPIGSAPAEGRAAIRERYREAFEVCGGSIKMVADGAVRIAGHRAVAASLAYLTIDGQAWEIETSNAAVFNEDGLMTEMKVYVGPTNFKSVAG